MRKPLLGWEAYYGRTRALCGPAMLMAGGDGEWEVNMDDDCGCVDPALVAAQLAAENAARAMVADMAKALGGSVTWDDTP